MSFILARRSLLGFAAAAVACPLCAAGARAEETHAAGAAPHWAYEGPEGPSHWGGVCASGTAQSPIDLHDATAGKADRPDMHLRTTRAQVENNGHTIVVNCEPGSITRLGDTEYELKQFHFHHKSEHLLAGKVFDMECHLVHQDAKGRYAVLGVFIEPGGRENQVMAKVWPAMPAAKDAPPGVVVTPFNPSGLIPEDPTFYRYLGSLTTPPCSEDVNWTVFRGPITASRGQIDRFAALFPNNARPRQDLRQRRVVEGAG